MHTIFILNCIFNNEFIIKHYSSIYFFKYFYLSNILPESNKTKTKKFNAKKFSLVDSEQIQLNKTKRNLNREVLEDVPVDHFSYVDSRKFKFIYQINTEHFNRKNAPIFYCVGDEASAGYDASTLGFIWELAQEFGAALVFVDHRYFSESYPFGNVSYTNVSNLGYLSTEQSLADNALLITYLKKKRLPNAENSPVILFGYSYGGMMAAWMRTKYPHISAGAIASSAPVRYFENVPNVADYSYVDNIMRVFVNNGCPYHSIMASFEEIRKLSKTANGRMFLNEKYHLSNLSQIINADDVEMLIGTLNTVMFYLTMVNYPYISNYLGDTMPAYSVKLACKPLSIAKTPEQLAIAPFEFINVLWNTTGTAKDFQLWNYTYDSFEDGWTWLECTELVFSWCERGPPFDPFKKTCPFNETDYFINTCLSSPMSFVQGYNKDFFRPNWLMTEYGYEYPTATNIIFSNGDADPWLGGAWRQTNTNVGSLYSLIVKDGTHGYDLRESHPEDTNSVKDVRNQERFHIGNWIREATKTAE